VGRVIALPHTKLFWLIQKLFWPAILMGVVVYALSFYLHFLLIILVGICVYGMLLFVTGGLSRALMLEFKTKLRGGANELDIV
jgi:hypothetical protein